MYSNRGSGPLYDVSRELLYTFATLSELTCQEEKDVERQVPGTAKQELPKPVEG